ncbi:type VI secretion system baseplate subunit TssG [Pendulispora rubella]|uniref:Type VI secretion system baseplate subunit TssG n=1 Tax=Pendulispora rubella TaxID=2741070 RepID=A0ABZ2KUE0_9BACT
MTTRSDVPAPQDVEAGLYELIRWLESTYGPAEDGEDLRFEHASSLSYPTASLAEVRTDSGYARVVVTLIGLLGASSPISLDWLEGLLHEETLRDDNQTPIRDFLDVLLHPFVTLLYTGWKQYTPEGAYDPAGNDRWSQRMRALAGIDAWAPAHSPAEEALPSMAAHGLTDHLNAMPRWIDVPSATAILRRRFPDLHIRLETDTQRRVIFGQSERTLLGTQRSTLGRNFRCGRGCRTTEGFVRVCAGPVEQETYDALMPGGPVYARLAALAERLLPTVAHRELEVTTASTSAPTFVLGRHGNRLGSTARISRAKSERIRVRVPLVVEPTPRIRRTFLST